MDIEELAVCSIRFFMNLPLRCLASDFDEINIFHPRWTLLANTEDDPLNSRVVNLLIDFDFVLVE